MDDRSPPIRMRHHDVPDDVERVATRTLDAAVTVHRALGPGLRERYYRDCLVEELGLAGVPVERELRCDLLYKGRRLPGAAVFDLVVDDRLLVELKAVEELHPHHFLQARSYVRSGGYALGILVNLQAARLVDGWHRILPGRAPSPVATVAASRRRMKGDGASPADAPRPAERV